MYYIVGLGNPESKYDGTRHNVGRDLVFALAGGRERFAMSKYGNTLYARDAEVEWLAPETYMNKSGETVRYVVEKHEAKPEDFIVVYDDVDLPVGEVKVSFGRGAGGHNGVADVIQALGSKDFARIRVGVAPVSFWTGKARRPEGGAPMTRHVLGKFSPREQKKIDDVQDQVQKALETIMRDGVEVAMNQLN